MDRVEAFERMYRSHRARVQRYVGRRVPANLVEDVVASTFSTVWRRLDAVPATEPERTAWLLRSASLICANELRALRRRHALVTRIGVNSGRSIVESADRLLDDLGPELAAALRALSPEDRYLLVATAVSDQTTAAVAKILCCSPGAARTRLSRIRVRLRARLTRPERPPDR